MAAILVAVLLSTLGVSHGQRFNQATCVSFELENGVVTPTQPHGYLDGEMVTVTCNAGHVLVGKSQITCSEDLGGWDQNRPQCVRSIVQCEFPDTNGGSMTRQSTSGDVEETEDIDEWAIIRPNDEITFRCGESSRMVIGDKTHPTGHTHAVTCMSNGLWGGPVPTCKHVTCEGFELANGNITTLQPGGYFDGDSVTVKCDAGYRLNGKTQLTCSTAADGWDDAFPTCKQVKCENLYLTNGYMYVISSSGQHSLLNKTSVIPSNTEVYFECQDGHRMRTDGTLQGPDYVHKVLCGLNGEWVSETPTCESVACQSFQLANGKVEPAQPEGYFDGDDVIMTCDAGYKQSGKSQLVCSPHGWKDDIPTCEQVNCKAVDFTNGNMYAMSNDGQRSPLTETSVIPSNTEVYFECQDGHRMRTDGTLQGPDYVHKVLCGLNGEWASETPTCESVACTYTMVPNGRLTPRSDEGYFNGATVNIECDAGYKLAGKSQIRCRADGWDNQPGQCIESNAAGCPKPQFDNGHMTRTYQEGDNILRGAVKPEDVIRAGDLIEFGCNYGYMMHVGDDTFMQGYVYQSLCQGDATWDHPLPTCQLFECSTPPTAPNLQYTVEGQRVQYSCVNDNYELLGPTTLTCRMDINGWFPQLPTCRRKACPTITWPENGRFLRQGRQENATVTAECNEPFTLNGTAHRECLTNGSWSGEPAVCTSSNRDCPNPGVPDGGVRTGNQFHVGARVTYSCGMDFILLGEAEQQCLQTGEWSAPLVKCLGPDEYSDPQNAINQWTDIINNIENDNREGRVAHQVFFLMDTSGSIRNSEIDAQRNFIGYLAEELPNTKMSWVAFNTTAFLLAERQNTPGIVNALGQRISTSGATNVRLAFKTVKKVLVDNKEINSTKVSLVLLLNDHINEGGSLSNAMRMKWAVGVRPSLYVVTMGGYVNRQDLIRAVSMYQPHSHSHAFFLKHKGDLNQLATGISTAPSR